MAKKMTKDEKKSKSTAVMIQRLILLICFLFGLSLLLYPLLSQSINDYLDQKIVQSYQEKASQKNKVEVEKIKKRMAEQDKKAQQEKNPGSDGEPFSEARRQKEKKVEPKTSYVKEHTVGTIVIPKIDVKLPVFDKTNDFFLSKGATILEGTSSIQGGPSKHSVISSHRGLKKAKLFTDLPKLKEQDSFFIEFLNETHAYEIDQVKVIEPTDTKDLLIVDGMDYVTLMTCTPYGVNSHRLLVRGHRIPYTKKMSKDKESVDDRKKLKQLMVLTSVILGALFLIWLIYRIIRTALIEKRTYQLSFYLIDDKTRQPAVNKEVLLTGHRGKRIVVIDGKEVRVWSDSEGHVRFPEIFGKVYGVKFAGESSIIARTKVKKLHDRYFSLRKKSKKITIKQTERILVLGEFTNEKVVE